MSLLLQDGHLHSDTAAAVTVGRAAAGLGDLADLVALCTQQHRTHVGLFLTHEEPIHMLLFSEGLSANSQGTAHLYLMKRKNILSKSVQVQGSFWQSLSHHSSHPGPPVHTAEGQMPLKLSPRKMSTGQTPPGPRAPGVCRYRKTAERCFGTGVCRGSAPFYVKVEGVWEATAGSSFA